MHCVPVHSFSPPLAVVIIYGWQSFVRFIFIRVPFHVAISSRVLSQAGTVSWYAIDQVYSNYDPHRLRWIRVRTFAHVFRYSRSHANARQRRRRRRRRRVTCAVGNLLPSPLFRIVIELSPLLMSLDSVSVPVFLFLALLPVADTHTRATHYLYPPPFHVYVPACRTTRWTRSCVATLLTYSRVGEPPTTKR